jgi:pyridinium-3,5-bisthiocarboxylic acid mononucleotide nickel chelatase
MRIAYLECFSGMSGDMFLGALIDAGVSSDVLEKAVAALDLGARIEISRVNRSGITATKVDVWVKGEKEGPGGSVEHAHSHEHGHPHDHAHEREHAHTHPHEVAHAHPHASTSDSSRAGAPALHSHDQHSHDPAHSHGRSLKEIRGIIGRAGISEKARQTALRIVDALGAAEAKIHNSDLESVHFHEVGAVDAIVDIVGAAVGAEALGFDEMICSPLNVGGGTVKCAHGVFPVPAPATVEILQGAPVYSSGIQMELLTPTGAAIVKTLAARFGAFPEMKIEKSGYGAGGRDLHGSPNVVRLVVGESTESIAAKTALDTVTVLEANLDDLNPQVFGYVMDRLLAEGALDVFGVPVQMKKNRPGTLLTVLCKPEDAGKLAQIIFAETTTLGVRRREEQRQTLARRWVSVSTQWGDVRMKIASMNGTVTNYAPEYEDCRRIAEEHRVPLKEIMNSALEAYSKTR